MKQFSFIDAENNDFIRDFSGNIIVLIVSSIEGAKDWLLKHRERYGWNNTEVNYLDWGQE